MEINPKYEKRFTAVIRAVVLATNNNPMIFTERAGGVARRRVIFRFDNIVSEAEKDRSYRKRLRLKSPLLSADCWRTLPTLRRHGLYYWNSVTVMKHWR